MATFGELKNRLEHIDFKTEVMRALVEYMDDNFRGDRPKLTLMTPSKVKVPDEVFEEVSIEISTYIRSLEVEKTGILTSELVVPTSAEAPQPLEEKKPTKGRKPKQGVEDGKPAV